MGKVSDTSGVSGAGMSIKEMIMEALVDATLDIMIADESDDVGLAMMKGKAQGLAWSLAIMMNPYDPSSAITGVRSETMIIIKRLQDASTSTNDDPAPA